jgi:hypothetical protein
MKQVESRKFACCLLHARILPRLLYLLYASFLSWLTHQHWKCREHVPPKHRSVFKELYGVTSHRIKFLAKNRCNNLKCYEVLVVNTILHNVSFTNINCFYSLKTSEIRVQKWLIQDVLEVGRQSFPLFELTSHLSDIEQVHTECPRRKGGYSGSSQYRSF